MKYDAFISYRHLEKDMYVAKKVHKALETTKIPRKIQKETGKKRIQRVFRDQEELPIGSDLGNNIEYALSESGFLIVICSPETQKSYWVMKEIDTFIATHGRENVLAVLVEGEPADSFPPQLLTDENGNPVEPLAADVRGENKREIDKKIKVETMRLAASVLGCDYDDLRQRHRERRVRRNMAIVSGVAVLGVAFGIYNAYNLARINENYQQKLINESRVLASTSLNVLENGDRKTAALIAMEGLPKENDDRPLVVDNIYALSRALGTYEIGADLKHDMKLTHHLPVKKFLYSRNGKYVISYDNGDEIYFWDLETGGLLFEKRPEYIDGKPEEILAVTVIEDNPVVLSSFFLTRYDKEGNIVYQKELSERANGGVFGKNLDLVAVCSSDQIELFDLNTAESTAVFHNQEDKSLNGSHIAISDDLKYVAVDFLDFDDDIKGIFLIDTKAGQGRTLTTPGSSVFDLGFLVDGNLAVTCMREREVLSAEKNPIFLQKFDPSTGEELFNKSYDYEPSALNMSYTQIRSRIYNDGTDHAEIFLSACKVLYTIDLYTGELIASYYPDSDIEAINISSSNYIVYVGTINGNLNVANGTTGEGISDHTIKVSDSIMRMSSGLSRVITSGYRSADLTVLSYLKDDSVEDFMTLDDKDIADRVMSPEETSFAISHSHYPEGRVVIYSTENGQELGEIDVHRITLTKGMYYLDDDTLVVTNSEGNIYVHTISTNETKAVTIGSEEEYDDVFRSNQGRYFLLETIGHYMVIDALEGKKLYTGRISEEYDTRWTVNEAILLSDASKFFFTNYRAELFVMDKEGNLTEVMPEYRALQIRLSKDDKVLLAVCADGYIRVIDAETLEVTDEVEYNGNTSSFIEISGDHSKLYMQGADLYLKIYDLNEKKFLFTTDDRIEDIYSVTESPENNLVALRSSAAMYFLDTNDYGFVAKADGGMFYMSKQNSIISVLRENVCKVKVKSLDDLIQEVEKQFGDATLTEEQRRKYKLD